MWLARKINVNSIHTQKKDYFMIISVCVCVCVGKKEKKNASPWRSRFCLEY